MMSTSLSRGTSSAARVERAQLPAWNERRCPRGTKSRSRSRRRRRANVGGAGRCPRPQPASARAPRAEAEPKDPRRRGGGGGDDDEDDDEDAVGVFWGIVAGRGISTPYTVEVEFRGRVE